MGNPPTITRTLQDTVSYKTRTGMSVGGVPTYGSLQTASAKEWSKQEIVRSGTGEDLVTLHYINTYTNITKGSLLWLSGEDTDDDDAAHVVDIVEAYDSCAVRGSQWTLYVIKVE
jgi:hypothetical protein